MALQDPNAPLFPQAAYWDDDLERRFREAMSGVASGPAVPAAGEQQILGDVGAPLVGALLSPPQPAASPPPPARPAPTANNPFPEAYDDFESKGGQPPYFDPRSQTYRDPATGGTVFPFGPTPIGPDGQPMPVTPGRAPVAVPRTDDARIGLHGGNNVAEEVARGGHLDAVRLPWEDIEMPDDVVGRPENTVEMPDDFVGRPALPEVDAISGGMAPGQDQLGAHQASGKPEMPIDYLNDEELGLVLANMPAEAQEMYRAKVEGARQNLKASKLLEAAEETKRRAEENARIYESSVAESRRKAAALDEEAQFLAQQKIDPDRWWGSRSTGQKVAGFIAAIVGGLSMSATGGRNIGLEAIEREIDRDIEVQKQNLHNAQQGLNARRSALSDEYARTGDLFQAQEKVRIASLDATIQKLEAEVQNFDPRGTTALRVMDTLNQARARRAEWIAKYQTEEQKRLEAAAKLALERQKAEEDARHHRAQEKADATRAGADWLRAKTDAKKADAEIGADALLTPAELRARGINIPENANVPPMTLAQAEKLAKTAKSVEDWNKAARENSPEEINRQLGVGELVDSEGKALKFRSAESAEKIATLKGSADFAVQLLDRIEAAREKYGWSSDLFKSPEWREIRADWSQYRLEQKNVQALGVLAGPDLGLIDGTVATSDPTEARDPLPGIRRGRANIVEKLNSTVRAQVAPGVKPARWEPPKPPPPAPKSPQQETVQKLLTFDAKHPRPDEMGELGSVTSASDRFIGTAEVVPPSYTAAIDRLVAAFNSPETSDKERDEAGAHLRALQTQAASAVIREYATKAAQAGAMASIPVSKD